MTREEAKAFYPILQAFAEGKVIETRTDPNVVGKGLEDMNYWTEMNEIEHWNNIQYRVKPEPTYRPFANAEECWAEMQKHQPFGWIKGKLAKKIMRHNTPYWIFRYLCYNRIMLPGAGYKVDFKDHRIIKAISLTDHWNARRYINELIKTNKKYPFKLREVQRGVERLKQYSV